MKSNETLFLSCSVVVPSKELEEIRQMVIKQMEEGVVILPYYLTMVSPRVLDELEKIKAEFEEDRYILLNQTVAIQIIDKHIAELKGE